MLSISYEILTQSLLVGALAIAAVIDIRTHRVPNQLIGLLICVACLIYAMQLDLDGFAQGSLGLLAGLLVYLPFYIWRGMGAGDVKLMAACGFYLGPEATLIAAAASLVVGAVMGIVYWLAASVLDRIANNFPRFTWTLSPSEAGLMKQRLPFAGAIATGVTIVVVMQYHNVLMEFTF